MSPPSRKSCSLVSKIKKKSRKSSKKKKRRHAPLCPLIADDQGSDPTSEETTAAAFKDDLTIGGTTADPHSTTAAAATSNDAIFTKEATSTAETSTTETEGVVSTSSNRTETNSREVSGKANRIITSTIRNNSNKTGPTTTSGNTRLVTGTPVTDNKSLSRDTGTTPLKARRLDGLPSNSFGHNSGNNITSSRPLLRESDDCQFVVPHPPSEPFSQWHHLQQMEEMKRKLRFNVGRERSLVSVNLILTYSRNTINYSYLST